MVLTIQDLICFLYRKGLVPEHTATTVAPPAPTPSPTAASATAAPTAAARVLEWWEIPSKYRRMPIDELECDAINMGAREKPYC